LSCSQSPLRLQQPECQPSSPVHAAAGVGSFGWRMGAFEPVWIAWGRGAHRTPDRFDRQIKKTVVPTTAARGTAVSNRRMTAVQSVYIPAVETHSHHLRRGARAMDVPATSRFTVLISSPKGGRWGSSPVERCSTFPWTTPSPLRRGSHQPRSRWLLSHLRSTEPLPDNPQSLGSPTTGAVGRSPSPGALGTRAGFSQPLRRLDRPKGR